MSFCKSIAERQVCNVRGASIHWLRETGESAAKVLASTGNTNFDFIFIDGDHSYEGVRGDWEAWKPLIKKDGLVLFHDSCSTASRDLEGTGVVRLIDNVVTADPSFRRVDVVESISVFQRVK